MVAMNNTCSNHVTGLLQTATVLAEGKSGERRPCRLLMDSGSERSFIQKKTSRQLRCQVVGSESMTIHGFGGMTSHFENMNTVQVYLTNRNDDQGVSITVLETDKLCSNVRSFDDRMDIPSELVGLSLADEFGSAGCSTNITILIGADYYWTIIMEEDIRRTSCGLVAMKSRFGYVLHGPLFDKYDKRGATVSMLETTVDVNQTLRDFWEIESLGIKPDEQKMMSRHDRIAMEAASANLDYSGHNYRVNLLWNDEVKKTVDGNSMKKIAEKRLWTLRSKLLKDAHLLCEYWDAINEYIKNGITEPTSEEVQPVSAESYLPHHAVVKQEKDTSKVRIVFDASCKDKDGTSLNDCLLSGPSLVPEVYDVLLRFRSKKFAFASDIKKAFLQIVIKEEDRDALRFLWYINLDDLIWGEDSPGRMTRVVSGVSCSPFLLASTIMCRITRICIQVQWPVC